MKTRLTLLTVMFLVSTVVVAQDYNKGLKKELEDVEEMYPTRKTTKVEVTKVKTQEVQNAEVYGPQLPANIQQPGPVAANQAAPAPQQQITQQQPIYILQQPTTNVEATTVKESRAEQLRKQREEVERQNESKLLERLEDERLNAEKERTEKLLAPPAPVAAKPEQSQVQVVSSPNAVVVPVQQEVISAGNVTAAAVVINKTEENQEKNKFVVGLLGGAANYPAVGNVGGGYALGGSFEVRFPNRIGLEGTTTFSSFDVSNITNCPYCYYGTPLLTTMNQWDFSGGFNYTIFKSTLSPIIGVMLDYTRRDYSSRVTYGTGATSYTGSNAFNGGFLAGFEVHASDSLIIGGELRYLINISYRTDNPASYGYGGVVYNVGTPIESLSYYTATLSTKLLF